MKCLSCDVILNDKEQLRKYKNHEAIKNPEDKYICLCNKCFSGANFDDDELEAHVPDDYSDEPNVFLLDEFRKD